MNRHIVSLLFLSAAAATQAADSPNFDPKRLSEHVRIVAADEFEGRGPGTAGEVKTIDYLTEQLKAAGVQPGGDVSNGARSWTQAVPLRRSQIAGTPSLNLSLGGEARALTQGEDLAIRAALTGAEAVKIDSAPLVFVGYGINAPERQWNDFKDVDLKGKIAVVLINDPDYETGQGDFGGRAMTYYGRWTYKFEEGARRGAAGVLIVHETEPASYGWATVKNSNTNAMFDIVRERPGEVHPAMEGWMQRDLAVELFKRAGLDFEAEKKKAQTREFKPVVLGDAKLSADYRVNSEIITSYNVVGRIEGSERPDETVIYSAHWDHLGVGQPDANGDSIYNGAVDNGTGIGAVIEMARAFASGPQPQRSVVFLLVTAEEKGLLGSEYYASNPLYPLGKTVAVLNIDALDPYGPARNFTTSGSAEVELLDQLVATAKRWGLYYSADPKPEAGYFFRSDHFPFAKRGVPAVSFDSGNDLEDGGIKAGEARSAAYTAERYHQPDDEWQADWSFTGMARDLAILHTLGSELANSRAWPNWGRSSEFRAARDASAPERK